MFVYTIDDIVAGVVILVFVLGALLAWLYDNANKLIKKFKERRK